LLYLNEAAPAAHLFGTGQGIIGPMAGKEALYGLNNWTRVAQLAAKMYLIILHHCESSLLDLFWQVSNKLDFYSFILSPFILL
jgi:hypothetical protein